MFVAPVQFSAFVAPEQTLFYSGSFILGFSGCSSTLVRRIVQLCREERLCSQ